MFQLLGGDMKKYAGIWLDHKKAIVVSLTTSQHPIQEALESVDKLESAVDRKVRDTFPILLPAEYMNAGSPRW